jgi:hypothetical protein
MTIPVEELELLTEVARTHDLTLSYAADPTLSLHLNGSRHALVLALFREARFAAWVRLVAQDRPTLPARDVVRRAAGFQARPFLVVDPSLERLVHR